MKSPRRIECWYCNPSYESAVRCSVASSEARRRTKRKAEVTAEVEVELEVRPRGEVR